MEELPNTSSYSWMLKYWVSMVLRDESSRLVKP